MIPGSRRIRGPLDAVGVVLVVAAALVTIYGVIEAIETSWSAPVPRVAFAISIVLGVVFFETTLVRRERQDP